MTEILVVDDDEVTRNLLQEVFLKEGYRVTLAVSGEAALKQIAKQEFPLVLSDIRMLELDGMGLLAAVKQKGHRSVVVLMTGFGSMETAVEAVQKGAFDYVSKPFRIEDLKAVIARAAKHWSTVMSPAKSGAKVPAVPFSTKVFIGRSPQIVEVYKILARATISDSSVLITGESGTGKELIARAIHDNSPRKLKKFVAVNCGALAETLLESELFGHLRGAFTGANHDKVGLFEEANDGTLFLDEIGDISPAMQIKLLRVLQEGEIKAVGDTRTRKVDVRVIAATHRDLDEMVRTKAFREDLYYRLKVIAIDLPPLRSRLEDLPELLNFFLARYSEKNKKSVSHISEDALELLNRYPWPGNVRELEHAVERAVAMTRTNVLFPEDFPPEISRGFDKKKGGASIGTLVGQPSEAVTGPERSLEEVERAHILKVLEDVKYNKSRASEILGIDRATLYRKAQRYGIRLGGRPGERIDE